MNEGEKKSRHQGQEYSKAGPCWGPGPWAGCCCSIGEADSGRVTGGHMPHAMARCFRSCRYFLLFAVILAIIVLVCGYLLNPETVRTWWMIGAAMVAALALFAVLVTQRMTDNRGFSGCCGTRPGRNARQESANDEFKR